MVLIDTHILVWWVNGGEQLSEAARAALKDERQTEDGVLVSSISAWEIALLVTGGRLGLPMDFKVWLDQAARMPGVTFIPIGNDIAIDAVTLPGEFHKDPADRIIVATARKFAAPIITADEKIRAYKHVRSIW